jgi:hypothetical protein
MGVSFGRTGRTSLELFKQDPENLKIKLKPLRSEEANRDLLISFQVRSSHCRLLQGWRMWGEIPCMGSSKCKEVLVEPPATITMILQTRPPQSTCGKNTRSSR